MCVRVKQRQRRGEETKVLLCRVTVAEGLELVSERNWSCDVREKLWSGGARARQGKGRACIGSQWEERPMMWRQTRGDEGKREEGRENFILWSIHLF